MTTTVPGAGSSRHAVTAAEHQARSQHLSRRPSSGAGVASNNGAASATHDLNDGSSGGIAPAVIKAVFFVIGCALLVACAFALDRLGAWSADHGRVWVFLAFFLVMSLGGRWFWAGADAAIGWVKARLNR